MKFDEAEVESIFAYAEALEKSGRQKNAIFARYKTIYILNYDKTVLLSFACSKPITPIGSQVAFFASDYEGAKFELIRDLIGFTSTSNSGDWVRTTTCKIPNQSYDDVESMYGRLYSPVNQVIGYAIIDRGVTDLIKESLSHIELVVKNGGLSLIQRDIYSGSVSEIRRTNREGLGLIEEPYQFTSDPAPLGMRTQDFLALFSFTDKVTLKFLPEEYGYFMVESPHAGMIGILGGCLYDSIGELNSIQKEKENGWKKSQDGNIEPPLDPEVESSERKPMLLKRRIK